MEGNSKLKIVKKISKKSSLKRLSKNVKTTMNPLIFKYIEKWFIKYTMYHNTNFLAISDIVDSIKRLHPLLEFVKFENIKFYCNIHELNYTRKQSKDQKLYVIKNITINPNNESIEDKRILGNLCPNVDDSAFKHKLKSKFGFDLSFDLNDFDELKNLKTFDNYEQNQDEDSESDSD